MHTQFRALLAGNAALAALLPGGVHWRPAPQGTVRPYAVLDEIGTTNEHTMQGPDKLNESRVQVSAYADTYAQAAQIKRAVKAAADGHRGGIFQGIFHAGTRDGSEVTGGEAQGPRSVNIDFLIKWSE
ncbi:tail completion protein gp17 [Paracoccus sp. (in: a-proteobacteria)]|uniref:tail completion protein gp17 n=1 Tax=Paracoccus sp. TaxID=267 RepID=UPI00272A8551|nr:DUF3168 domain-containing protein [Paracoccus sp. (in: a-proteobacteria)]